MKIMDKSIVILLSILILLIGIYFIIKIYNNEELNILRKNKNELVQARLINSHDYYKLYELTDGYDQSFEVFINNTSISYSNRSLLINTTNIIDDVDIINKIVFYNDLLVMYVKDSSKNYVILYNNDNLEYQVIDSIDNMSITNIESSDISEAGYDLYLSNVFNEGLVIGNNLYNPCEYKDNIIVKKHVIYFYDKVAKEFSSSDVIDQTYLNEYKKGIC